MRSFFALSCLLAVALAMPQANQNDAEWEEFKKTHGKTYESNDSESVRKAIYFLNKERVEAHNIRYKQGLETFGVKLNHLSDMLPEEAAKLLNGYKRIQSNSKRTIYQPIEGSLPASVDWRQKGVVTPIKNQGSCGGCWAFSATGSLEGQTALKTGKLVSLSEQNLIDCSKAEGNMGCNGGLMDYAFEYIQRNGGIDTEQSYPFTAEDGNCAFKKANVAAKVTGYVDIESGSETSLQNAVANVGPVSVAIDASSWAFQLYSEGVYNVPSCSSDELDHGVLAVGYGESNGTPYWLVKNSWGTSWGQNGYIWMSRNKSNQCGIATEASYPKV